MKSFGTASNVIARARLDALIGGRLAARRNMLTMSSEQVSREAGLSDGELSKIESGLLRPDAGTLLNIAKVLDLTLYDLFDGVIDDLSGTQPR